MTRDEAIAKVTAALERTGDARSRSRSTIGADITTIEALGLITFDKTLEECDLRAWRRRALDQDYVHNEYGESCPCRMCRPAPQAEATVPRDPSAMKPKRAETSDHVGSAEVQLALRRAIGDPADWTNAEGLAYAIYNALRMERLWVVRRR